MRENGSSKRIKEMAHLEGEPSNALFEELANWNEILRKSGTGIRGPRP